MYSPLVDTQAAPLLELAEEQPECAVLRPHRGHRGKLFALACKRDLEGLVANHKFGPYLEESAQWFKIRNRKYSQWAGREKFFEREREVDPDMTVWDSCVLACEEAT